MLGIESIIKAIYKPIANIIFNDEKLKLFSLRSGTRQKCPLSLLLLDIVLGFLVKEIGQEKECKVSKSKGRS